MEWNGYESRVSGAKVVNEAASLLGVDPAALTQCLLHGSYKTPSGQVKLNNYQAHKVLEILTCRDIS